MTALRRLGRAIHSPPGWAAVAAVVLFAVLATHEPPPDRFDEALPRFELAELNGNRLDSSSLLGKPWVIALWMPDCNACTEDLAAFEAARHLYETRGVGFLAV